MPVIVSKLRHTENRLIARAGSNSFHCEPKPACDYNDHGHYDHRRTKPKTGKWALLIDLISKRIAYHLPKGKFILHDTLFNMTTGIQIKFHQDTMTHILKKILKVILKRSVVSPYLKPDIKRQTVDNNMKQSLTPDCSRFLVFDFNTSQALLFFLSVMYSCNFSLFHRDKILNPIQARLF